MKCMPNKLYILHTYDIKVWHTEESLLLCSIRSLPARVLELLQELLGRGEKREHITRGFF